MKGGFLWIYKKSGITTREALNTVQRRLKVKGGYEGTLDPFAEGLLIVGVGHATRFLKYYRILLKTYEGILVLGKETDTLDITGKVIRESSVPPLGEDKVISVLKSFLGEYEQVPPKFSAIRVKGRRAYNLAREGKEFSLKPRRVYIESMELKGISNNRIRFICKVSSGTYIRALGKDIAHRLGTFGYLERLIRLKIGDISHNMAKLPEEVDINDIVPMDKGLYWMESIHLYENEGRIFRNGGRVFTGLEDAPYKVYVDGEFVGIGEVIGGYLKPERLLPV